MQVWCAAGGLQDLLQVLPRAGCLLVEAIGVMEGFWGVLCELLVVCLGVGVGGLVDEPRLASSYTSLTLKAWRGLR